MASHVTKRILPPITALEIPPHVNPTSTTSTPISSASTQSLLSLSSSSSSSSYQRYHHSTILPPVSSLDNIPPIISPGLNSSSIISTNNSVHPSSSLSTPTSPPSLLYSLPASPPSFPSQHALKNDIKVLTSHHHHPETNASYFNDNNNNSHLTNYPNFDHHQPMRIDYSHRLQCPPPSPYHNQHNVPQHQTPLSPLSPNPSTMITNNNNYHPYATAYNNNHKHSSATIVGSRIGGSISLSQPPPPLTQQQQQRQLPPQMMMMIDQAGELLAEKRRRNAGASARFRDRRKQREREMQERCAFLEKRVQELEGMDRTKRIIELEKKLEDSIKEKISAKSKILELEKEIERLSSKSRDNVYDESLTPPCSSSGDYDPKDNVFEESMVAAVTAKTKPPETSFVTNSSKTPITPKLNNDNIDDHLHKHQHQM